MDGNSPIQHSIASSKVKHRFFHWATKWCYGDIEQSMEKPDVPGVVCLLQALGCQLREYEKNEGQDEELKSNSMRIVMECGKSKMRAVLELNDINCQCSRPEDAKDASYWSVCGTAPTGSCDSINKFEETGSNLLPQVTRDDRAMIRDVLYRLLETINTKGDINLNRDSTMTLSTVKTADDLVSPVDKSESFARSFTQPEIYRIKDRSSDDFTPPPMVSSDRRLSMSVQNIRNIPLIMTTESTPERSPKPSILRRQKTWDLDVKSDGEPRPSPPKISGSPVVLGDLCSSLGQVSLQSEDENLSLAECLRKAKYYIEKAQNSYGSVSPGPRDDVIFAKPLPLRPRTSPRGTRSRPSPAFSSASNLSSKSTTQAPLVRRSIGPQLVKQPPISNVAPPKHIPHRRRTECSLQLSTKPVIQRNASSIKSGGKSSPSTSSNSSLSSVDFKIVSSTKRTISQDSKSQSPLVPKPGISDLKKSTPKSVTGINRSHSSIPLGNSGSRGNTPKAKDGNDSSSSPCNVSLNSSGRKSVIGVAKSSVLKKEK